MMLVFIFQGCTQALNSTLLSAGGKPCEENCTTSTPGTITGELGIIPDEGEIFASPEGTDLVEISGSCKDLGRDKNRILVQVFEGEDDSRQAIIDNSIDLNCQDNISTTSLLSSGGVGKTCMLVAQGIGLADQSETVAKYPQCFNGRFSFQLRFGRIIRKDTFLNDRSDATNPKVRYLVKMKLRTNNGATSDSAAATMVVRRDLPTPIFSVTPNKENDRCEINFNPSKFRDSRYTLYTTWTGPSWAASGSLTNTVSGTIYADKQPTFPPLGDGTTIEKFYHFGQPIDPSATIGLMPGVTYTYRMQSADYSFRNVTTPSLTDYEVQFGSVSGAVERSEISNNVSCTMGPAYVSNRTEQNQGVGTPNSCLLQLAGYNMRGYSIEWRVSSTSPTWMVTNPNSGFLISAGGDSNCRGLSTCSVHGHRGISSATTYIDSTGTPQFFQPNIPYYFAARHFIDTNGNTRFDPGVDQLAGDWSPATNVTNSADFNHRCTFNTFPVQ
jgi:hypothetical protein